MSVVILRGDARSLPLPDESVDLVVTSPPYSDADAVEFLRPHEARLQPGCDLSMNENRVEIGRLTAACPVFRISVAAFSRVMGIGVFQLLQRVNQEKHLHAAIADLREFKEIGARCLAWPSTL